MGQNCPKYVTVHQKRFSCLHCWFQHIHRDCEWLVLVQVIILTYMSHKQSEQVWDRVHDKTIYRPALPGTSTTQSTRRDESRYFSWSSSLSTWRINDIPTLTSNIVTNVVYMINIITTTSIIDILYMCEVPLSTCSQVGTCFTAMDSFSRFSEYSPCRTGILATVSIFIRIINVNCRHNQNIIFSFQKSKMYFHHKSNVMGSKSNC